MSWSAGGEWGWSETWPAMGKGKGKKGGKKGKGKNQSYPEEDTWGQSSLTEHTGRIRSQYQLPHKLLKASADTDGSALVKATKMADDAFLSQKNLKRVLSTENTHLLRRPGWACPRRLAVCRLGQPRWPPCPTWTCSSWRQCSTRLK